ncbi:MAG TPA: ADP-ribosylation factor-like protein [Polyangiaceae bacterium]
MPVVNPLAREVVFKVVYYGPGLGGKTTSLQYIHATARPEHRGKMVSLATPVDRTLYFDFLPIRLPNVRGMNVRLQLFTVPGQVYYNATRKLVLTGADGLVLVFDSQRVRSDANEESWQNLQENLEAHGRQLSAIPHVIQYNKRDLYDAVPIDELEQLLNRHRAPSFGSCAMNGEGIYEALEVVTRAVLDDFQERMPGEGGGIIGGLGVAEGGLAEALRGAEAVITPRPMTRVEPPRAGGELRLSQLPENDAGETAARLVVGDASAALAEAATDGVESTRGTGTSGTIRPHKSTLKPAPLAPSAPLAPVPPVAPAAPAPASRGSAAVPEARPLHEAAPRSLGFELLWPLAERGLVRELEAALAAGDHARALASAEGLVARSLAGAAAALGTNDAPRDPATVALVLGIDGRRYLEFRALARDARAGRGVSAVEALGAYALAIQIRLARAGIAG